MRSPMLAIISISFHGDHFQLDSLDSPMRSDTSRKTWREGGREGGEEGGGREGGRERGKGWMEEDGRGRGREGKGGE